MAKINPSQSVAEIAVEMKESIPLFEKFGIDYCCEGGRTLKDACYYVGIPLEEVTEALEKIEPAPKEWYKERDWRQEPLAELIGYILKKHHTYARSQMRRVKGLMYKVVTGPGGPPPELATIHSLFNTMADEMENHLRREEEVVFPYLIEAEQCLLHDRPLPQTFSKYDSFNHPLRVLEWEHGMTDREWKEIDRLTDHFRAPESRRMMLQPLYDALLELEKDNIQHLHLENNILLKRANQMGFLD